MKHAAHAVMDAFTADDKDKDIAKTDVKHQELHQKEEMDCRRYDTHYPTN
jgi:hypothetical protein